MAPANERPRGSGGLRGTLDASHDYDRKRNAILCPTERSRRLADARPVCAAAWAADPRCFSRRSAGRANLRDQGFRDVRLSAGLLSPGELLARRASALESVEPLRGSLPGPMEHADPLPVLAHLSAAALELVPVVLLPGASFLGRVGHVFPRLSLDPPPPGGGIGRADLRIQRPVFECADVAKHRGHVRLAALGRVAGAAGLAGGRENGGVGDARGRSANAGGRPPTDPANMVYPAPSRVRRLLPAQGSVGEGSLAIIGDGDSGRAGLRRAIAAVPGAAGPLAARYWLRLLRMVDAGLGLGQFPGAALPDPPHRPGPVPAS